MAGNNERIMICLTAAFQDLNKKGNNQFAAQAFSLPVAGARYGRVQGDRLPCLSGRSGTGKLQSATQVSAGDLLRGFLVCAKAKRYAAALLLLTGADQSALLNSNRD
jgi:hypothetical protein